MNNPILPDQSTFERYVPAFADSEPYVYEQIAPLINEALDLSDHMAPYNEQLSRRRQRHASLTAAARAVRHLDLVLTGSGFGVISTGDKAPASQARVDALHTQLLQEASDAWDTLVDAALQTRWNAGPGPELVITSLLHSPTLFREYGATVPIDKPVYAHNIAPLISYRDHTELQLKRLLTPAFYESLLNFVRRGGIIHGQTWYSPFDRREESAFFHTIVAARRYIASSLRGSNPSLHRDDVLRWARYCPGYVAPKKDPYQNEQDQPTFFFS